MKERGNVLVNIALIFFGILMVVGFATRYYLLTKKQADPQVLPKIPAAEESIGLSEKEAFEIAKNICIKRGETFTKVRYSESSRTWRFDANLNATKEGCSPLCVVSEDTNTAELIWECEGDIEPSVAQDSQVNSLSEINNFDDCIKAGNPILESLPEQCKTSDGRIFTKTESETPALGGDKDEHGCIGSAGYQWCELKQQCLRFWEESCYVADEEAIKLDFSKKYRKSLENIKVTINTNTGNHARGNVIFGPFGPNEVSGIFLAVKINDVWQSVYDGNKVPCSLLKYNFPPEMISDCIN